MTDMGRVLCTHRNRATAAARPPMSPFLMLLSLSRESPGSDNEKRDYRHKRSEYAARKIPEYWIVDPEQKQVTLLTLVEGLYEEAVFTGSDRLLSLTFPTMQLTAEQVLSGKL